MGDLLLYDFLRLYYRLVGDIGLLDFNWYATRAVSGLLCRYSELRFIFLFRGKKFCMLLANDLVSIGGVVASSVSEAKDGLYLDKASF